MSELSDPDVLSDTTQAQVVEEIGAFMGKRKAPAQPAIKRRNLDIRVEDIR